HAGYYVSRQQVFASDPSATVLHDWIRIPPKVSLVPGSATVVVDPVTGKYFVDFTLKQQGNVPLYANPITATVNGVAASPLDNTVEDIFPGTTADWTALFPRSLGPGFKVM